LKVDGSSADDELTQSGSSESSKPASRRGRKTTSKAATKRTKEAAKADAAAHSGGKSPGRLLGPSRSRPPAPTAGAGNGAALLIARQVGRELQIANGLELLKQEADDHRKDLQSATDAVRSCVSIVNYRKHPELAKAEANKIAGLQLNVELQQEILSLAMAEIRLKSAALASRSTSITRGGNGDYEVVFVDDEGGEEANSSRRASPTTPTGSSSYGGHEDEPLRTELPPLFSSDHSEGEGDLGGDSDIMETTQSPPTSPSLLEETPMATVTATAGRIRSAAAAAQLLDQALPRLRGLTQA
jgi:hypothetical protein